MHCRQSDHALPIAHYPKKQPNCLSRQASFRLPGNECQAVVGGNASHDVLTTDHPTIHSLCQAQRTRQFLRKS
jgi:hypothetical protein